MTIIVLGADGMLGHTVYKELHRQGLSPIGTIRGSAVPAQLPKPERIKNQIDILHSAQFVKWLEQVQPEVVVNCIGLITQRHITDPVLMGAVNCDFPRSLAALVPGQLIHMSTNGVFSSQKSPYREEDSPDPEDLYGLTKAQGEVNDQKNVLTLRTSIIGREIKNFLSLVEWFVRARESEPWIRGFTDQLWNGVTTNFLARLISSIIQHHPKLHGLYHVSCNEAVAKYNLLSLIDNELPGITNIRPVESGTVIDQTLISERIWEHTGLIQPGLDELIAEMMETASDNA